MQEVETTLFHLPKPAKHHLDHLQNLLKEIEQQYGLNEVEIEKREKIAGKVQVELEKEFKCKVRLYGSAFSGFGLKDSVLNLDLEIDQTIEPHVALLKSLKVSCVL